MNKTRHLKLIEPLSKSEFKRKNPSLKDQIYIGLSTLLFVVFILALALLLPKPANASEVFGVEFNNINWIKLCPNTKPLVVGGCDTVHPTSALARNFKSDFESFSNKSGKPNCEVQKDIYDKRVASSTRRCSAMFRTSYNALATSKGNGVFTAIEFRDTYLSEGVVNANALPRY